jgi:DNA-directed RNA polymerase specialized sigma24 family protein
LVSGHPALESLLDAAGAAEDFGKGLGEAFDLELLEKAREEVSERVELLTWEVYRRVVEEGQSGKEVAGALGIQVANVYVYAGRVKKLLREAVARLELQRE